MDSPWLPPSKGPQYHPTYTGGARPKVPTKPSAGWFQSQHQSSQKRSWIQLTNHPCRWIYVENERARHPHWWKEMKASGRVFMGSQIVREGLSNSRALLYAQWQSVALRLPATQQETSGWWDAPPWLSGLHPEDFMLCTNASSPRDFWAVRQEKTLALAWVLQACTEGLEVPIGVLCNSAQELQKCMAPLMTLSRNDIIEVSLLKPTKEECGTSPL